MRYFIYITSALLLLLNISCEQDEFDFEGPAVSFYPSVVERGSEEDGITYILPLAVSGPINNSGTAIVRLNTSADGVISTIPALDGNRIEVEFNATREAIILVTIDNDAVPEDYTATFTIVGTSGEIVGIGRNQFTLIVDDTDVAPVFSENFNDCNNLNSFTPYSVSGSQGWTCTTFGRGGASGARMNGFSGGAQENEDWLISEALDLNGLGTASVSFYTDRAFTGPELEIRVSTDYSGTGDPSSATWVTLPASYDEQAGNDTWTYSGNLDISDYLTAATYFAFVYTSSPSAGAAQWTVDDFEISIFHPNASGGGNDNLATLPFEDDFETCTTDFNTPGNWTEWFLTDKNDNGFGCRGFGVGSSRGVRVSAFNGEAGTIDTWLISNQKFDLRDLTSGTLTFDVQSAAPGDGTLEVFYSTNYFREGPALATWTELDIAGQLPGKGTGNYVTVGGDIPGGQIVYIAFRFSGGSQLNSASYDIDNVSFQPFEFGTLPFTEDFSACGAAGTFNIPENWIEVNVPGSKTDRGWGCNDFGRTGSGMRASAFGGAAGFDNAWLISEGKFDLADLTNVTLSFWVEDRFTGPGTLTVKWSADYPGSGNPTSYTWTTLSDVTAQLPGNDTRVFTQVTSNLSAAAGQQVHIAFQYTDGTNSSAGAFTIDDISLTGN